MKILKNFIGDRTGDLQACSAVSQPAVSPRAPDLHLLKIPKYKERFAKFENTSAALLRIQAFCEVTHCLWVRCRMMVSPSSSGESNQRLPTPEGQISYTYIIKARLMLTGDD
jgi:hypothetical protein